MSQSLLNITILPNGTRLVLVPMEGVNSVATSVMVSVGSRYETPDINGVSHFLEHMVFKGTKKYPTTDDVNFIERLGGLQNAYTDIDITCYHNKVISTDWFEALDINHELALAPLLEEKHIDLERNVILEEMKRSEDEPSVKVGEAFHRMMYPDSPLGMRIIGEEASLRPAKAATLRAYHDRWYTPDRIVVVLTGRIMEYELCIMEKVEKLFCSSHNIQSIIHTPVKDIKSQKKPNDMLQKATINQQSPRLSIITKPDAKQAHMIIGIPSFRRGSPDRFAWALFNLAMGVSFTSRLFREIREKRGLCYHIRSSSDNWVETGYWSIYAGVATEKVEEAVKAILFELNKAKTAGVLNEEVNIARKRLETMLAFRSEDPEFIGEWYGRQELFGDPVITIDDYIKKIRSITKDDINRLLNKYIQPQLLNMAIVWNRGEDEKLRDLLTL